MNAVEIKNINHFFGEHHVLRGLDLNISEGTIHSIVGVSGVGKTLSLRLIASLEKIQTGIINIKPGLKISFAFQGAPLIPWLTIWQNLAICSYQHDKIKQLLNEFQLTSFAFNYPDQLSGGMVQKVNIIRSFINNSDLILMDEPFVFIDSIQKEQLHQMLIQLWEQYKPTIIFVTHDIEEALLLSDKVSIFSKKSGAIQETIALEKKRLRSLQELKNEHDYLAQWNVVYQKLQEDMK